MATARGRAYEMLDLFELRQWENQLIESFSHGMKQRLVMSSAFLHRPQAVAVDEPMVGWIRAARADQGRVQAHERARCRDPDEHAHARSRPGDVPSRQHHSEGRIIAHGTVDEVKQMAGSSTTSTSRRCSEAHRRQRAAGNRRDLMDVVSLPAAAAPLGVAQPRAPARERRSASRNRLRLDRRRRVGALFYGAYWVTTQLSACEEFGDYLLRLGLSWLFLTFLAFLAFSGVVTSLSTFFLSDDLRLLMASPLRRGASFTRGSRAPSGRRHGWSSSSWRRCSWASASGDVRRSRSTDHDCHGHSVLDHSRRPRLGVHAVRRERVSGQARARPAHADGARVRGRRRAAPAVHPAERLLRVESLPDITDFFATLQSPITPMLPSFWAGKRSSRPCRAGSTGCIRARCGRRPAH